MKYYSTSLPTKIISKIIPYLQIFTFFCCCRKDFLKYPHTHQEKKNYQKKKNTSKNYCLKKKSPNEMSIKKSKFSIEKIAK